ncbi:MAG TPA: winged helix-turn-helix domain-containing protein [Acidobacteriota bacterium]|nr:winged helix-turn-helix domain-containing protein [Acidobacteriota bacterium]
MGSSSKPSILQFDDVRVEVEAFRVYKAGRKVPLEPKAFQTLLFLIEHRGKLVTKDEILDGVWSDTFVTPNALTRVVGLLRRALGDQAVTSRYIETIPTRGYRFIAEVTEAGREETPAIPPPIGPLAILPFKRLEGAEETERYLATGLADTLITKLAGVAGLSVRPTSAVLRFGALGEDPVAAGRELGSAFVLDGVIQQSADRIRVNVQFVRVEDGRLLWADVYDARLRDIFELQDELALRIVQTLKVKLSRDERDALAQRPENLEAYQFYLQGCFYLFRYTLGDLDKSIQCFQAAVERDAGYALAYSGLAQAHSIAASMHVPGSMTQSEAAALRALELDPTLAEAHAALGALRFWGKRDIAQAQASFRAALALTPRTALPCHYYAWFLTATGCFQEAERQMARALEMDPFSAAIKVDQGLPFYYSRRCQEARARFQKAADQEAGYGYAHLRLGEACEAMGEYEMAAEAFTRAADLGSPDSVPLLHLARCLALDGKSAQASRLLEKETGGSRPYSAYYAALAFLALDRHEDALASLEQALREGDRWIGWLNVDPSLDKLRGTPRFEKLRIKAGLTQPDSRGAGA